MVLWYELSLPGGGYLILQSCSYAATDIFYYLATNSATITIIKHCDEKAGFNLIFHSS